MCSCFVFLIALQVKSWKNFKPLCTQAIAQDFDFRVAAYSPRLWDKIWGIASILYFEILKLRKRSKTWRKYTKWCSVVSKKRWAKMCICKDYITEYRRENTETQEEKQRQMETKTCSVCLKECRRIKSRVTSRVWQRRRNEQKREWRQRNYRKRNMKNFRRRRCKILDQNSDMIAVMKNLKAWDKFCRSSEEKKSISSFS